MIVEERSNAEWGGDSGSCHCGLTVISSGTGTESGLRWTAVQVAGRTSFDLPVSCSPSASAAIAADSTVLAGGCAASYTATVHSVTINLHGTLINTDGSPNCLVGQIVRGELAGEGLTFGSWAWSIAGSTFKSYEVASDESYGRVHYLGSSDYASAQPTWSWLEEGTDTVSCSATAYYQGQSIGSVTAARDAAVWVPYSYYAADTYNFVHFTPPGTQDAIEAGNYDVSPFLPAIRVLGRVGTPDLFASAQSYGQWMLTQVLHGHMTETGGSPFDYTFAQWTLDNHFKYLGEHGPGSYDWMADSIDPDPFDLNTTYHATDGPLLGLPSNNVTYDIGLEFRMVQMFLPPDGGEGHYYVPLNNVFWAWTVSGSRTLPGPWPDPPDGSVVDEICAGTIDHPVWEHVGSNH